MEHYWTICRNGFSILKNQTALIDLFLVLLKRSTTGTTTVTHPLPHCLSLREWNRPAAPYPRLCRSAVLLHLVPCFSCCSILLLALGGSVGSSYCAFAPPHCYAAAGLFNLSMVLESSYRVDLHLFFVSLTQPISLSFSTNSVKKSCNNFFSP